jgi:ATP-binding cassette subfamily B protein
MARRRRQSIKKVLPSLLRILRTFAPQIRQQRSLLIVSSLALVGEVVTRLLEPWPLKYIFDGIILPMFGGQTAETLPLLGEINPMLLLTLLTLAIVVISGLRGMAAYSGIVGMSLAATHIMTDVRGRLYSHLQSLSLSFHHKAKHGDLITRVTYDIERLREVTVTAALPLIVHVLTLVGMVGLMFWLNWQLATLAIAVLPLFLLSTVKLGRKIQGVARRQRKREGAMAATAAESIGAIKVVQALSLQGMLESAFSNHNRKSLKEGAQAQRLAAQMERTVEVLVAIATALVLWRGVQLVQQQVVTAGDLLVFVNYLKMAFKPMRQLAKYTGQIAKATASGERIIDILDIVPEIRDTRGAKEAPPFRGEVQFLHVKFAYESDKGVLRDLDFKVQPGQRVALVGSSGGGKSTLVSLILRLYDPTEGWVLMTVMTFASTSWTHCGDRLALCCRIAYCLR